MSWDWLRSKILRGKMYLGRSMGYIGMFNAGSILFLLLSNLYESGYISTNPERLFIPIIFIGCVSFILIGWIEVKLKGIEKEAEMMFGLNPCFVDLTKRLVEIKQDVNEIKKEVESLKMEQTNE